MLRREVDGVAWHVARKAMFGGKQPPPELQMFWTSHGSALQVAETFWLSVCTFEAEMAAAGAPVVREQVYARAGTARSADLVSDGEVAAALRALDDVGRLGLRAVWGGFSLEVSEAASGSGAWTAQTFTSPIFDNDSLDRMGEVCSQVLVRLGESNLAVWGCVTLDHGSRGRTPYESYYPVEPDEAAESAARHPRGYYWSNLLTEGHITALGGGASVVGYCGEHGLQAQVVKSTPGAEAIIVRSGERISEFSDESLGAVYQLLDPILIHESYQWYAGWPLRVFKEPGTAFLKVDPTVQALSPIFDDDPEADGDDW